MSLTGDTDIAVPSSADRHLRRALATLPWGLRVSLLVVALAGVAGVLFLVVPELRSLVGRQSLIDAFAPPFTDAGLLGTDQLGRPMEWRLLAGLGISLGVAISVTAISVSLGLVLGIIAGFYGRVADRVVSVAVDVAWAYPAVLLAVVAAGILGPGLNSVILALGLSIWAAFARIVRAQVLSLREQEYVLAARALGYGRLYIAVHHLVPNLVPIGLVMASFYIALAVIAEAGLSFIGLGAQPPTPSLGGALSEGYTFVSSSPWPILTAAGAIILLVTTFNRLGDHLRDALDPHHQGRGGASATTHVRAWTVDRDTEHASEPGDDVAIATRNLTVVLDAQDGTPIPIVSGVSLDIRPGQTLGVVGESGSGKTVTARALIGLVPSPLRTTPDSLVRWDGQDIAALSKERLRRLRGPLVSMVFQDPRASLDPLYPIGRQIGEAIEAHHSLPRRAVRERVLESLSQVGLDNPRMFETRYPHEMSGGQLQRVMLAASLVLEPKVLIADEPTTGLDVTTQKRIVELVRSLADDLGMSVVWITHDLDLVADLVEDLIVMYAGETVEAGPTEQVLRHPRHPYTVDLLLSRPQAAERRKARLATIPGGVPEPGHWPSACRFAPRCRRVLDVCREEHPELGGSGDAAHRQWRCLNPEPREQQVAP